MKIESITLAQAIEDAASRPADIGFRFLPEEGAQKALPDGSDIGTFYSYAQMEADSARYAGALQELGLKKGDRVALILPTGEDFILTFFGALRAGIVPVPIYPPLGIGQLQSYLDNTRHIIAKSGARVLVTTATIRRLMGTVQAACPELRHVATVESIRESNASLTPLAIGLGDPAFIQFTSGSTSRPKGVTLTHGNLAANVRCIMQDGLKATDDDVGVSWLPLYHDMGLIGFVLAPLMCKLPIVFLPPLLFLKRPITWFYALTRYKGTIAFGPNFSYALCVKRLRDKDLSGVDLSSWRVAGCGAEPIRPETLETFADTFSHVGFKREALMPTYGMAESSLAISFSPVGRGMDTIAVSGDKLWADGSAESAEDEADGTIRLVSCGQPFPDHTFAVFDTEDLASKSPLPDGRVGEIRVRGPSVMPGYHEDPERTNDAFAGDYLRTGDLGFVRDGRLFICGRSKEVIIVNGRNYYPQDLEWEASQIPGVRKGNVIAFGARDGSGLDMDREHVVVALESQHAADPERARALTGAVRKAVQAGMGLTLDDVVVLAPGTLPKTSSGKLQRAKTRELYESGELVDRVSQKTTTGAQVKIALAKQAALSQLSYLKLAVLGGRRGRGRTS